VQALWKRLNSKRYSGVTPQAMKHIRNFLKKIKDTVYNPSFYQKITHEPTELGIWFLFLINVLSFTVIGIGLLVISIPSVSSFSMSDYIGTHYPDELTITIQDGVVEANIDMPYYIPLDEDEEGDPANLIVIDTTEGQTFDTISSYDTLAVLTRDSLVFFKSEGETRIFSLEEIKDFTFNKDTAISWGETIMTWTYILIIPFALLMIGIVACFVLGWYLLVSFIYALVPFFAAKLLKKRLTYMNAYKVSLYALVPAILFSTIISLLGLHSLPFLTLGIVSFVAIINIRGWTDEMTQSIPGEPSEHGTQNS
jgi:hypothetical protein